MNIFTKRSWGARFTSSLLVAIMLLTTNLSAQTLSKVSGRVLDEQSNPVFGVTVIVDGTTNGASTGMDGDFSIPNVASDANLMISYIGYKTMTIPVTDTEMQIVLKQDVTDIEEVVVVGFGTQKKVNLTGAVATADSEVFESRPVVSATSALQGAVAGLNVTSGGGGLSSDAKLNIRGVGTIGSGSEGNPLVLIDGMEGDINTINPQDIESVSVLKDAAASSIYGSRAPFGVILITTKKGEVGKMKINYNNSFRVSSLINLPEQPNSSDWITMVNASYFNNGKGGFQSADILQHTYDYYDGVPGAQNVYETTEPGRWSSSGQRSNDNINWYDEIYEDSAFGQEHNLSLSGGSENHQIYMSGNYLEQQGFLAMQRDNLTRLSANIRATGKVTDYLSYSYNVKFQNKTVTEPQAKDLITGAGMNAYPTTVKYDPNGNLGLNPLLALSENGSTREVNNQMYQQFRLTATPIKNWNIIAELNYKFRTQLNHTDNQMAYAHDIKGDPYIAVKKGLYNTSTSVEEGRSVTNFLNPNFISDYSFDINDQHNFKVLLGFQSERNSVDRVSLMRSGLIVDGMEQIDVTTGFVNGVAVSPEVSGNITDWATAGFFGRVNYDYEGRYMLELNMRYDGASRFHSDKRWDWFPSASVGWNIARERFWEPIANLVSNFKLRASYGELGNQNTTGLYAAYQEFSTFVGNGGYLVNGLQPNTSSSPSLLNAAMTWETVKNTNIGLDVDMFNNRLNLSADYFNRITANMVGPAPTLPEVLGTPVPKANNTDLETNGWELSLRWRDRLKNGLGYSVGLQLSDSKTVVTNYPNEEKLLVIDNETGMTENYYPGQNYGEIWGYTTIGIARTEEEMKAHLATTDQSFIKSHKSLTAGDIMFKDINGDGKIDQGAQQVGNSGDLSVIGNTTPRYTFGINLAADYKGFDINMFLQGVLKRDYFVNGPSFWGSSSGIWSSQYMVQHLDFYRAEDMLDANGNVRLAQNIDSYYPRPVNKKGGNYQVQSGYLQDASYIRLKNLQVGYTFPTRWLSKASISNMRIFISAENLWTGTKLSSIYDPETIDGRDFGINYPLQKVVSFGLNITL